MTADKKRIEEVEARIEQVESRIERVKTRAEKAGAQTEQAEIRTELAKTRTEQAEIRTELAKTRTTQAEIRTEQAEARAEQAEKALRRVVHKNIDAGISIPKQLLNDSPVDDLVSQKILLEKLTSRQREVLQFIAAGKNTKQIGESLKLSPKTVEYHRLKLMAALKLHDVPGLVRFALRAGLVAPES